MRDYAAPTPFPRVPRRPLSSPAEREREPSDSEAGEGLAAARLS